MQSINTCLQGCFVNSRVLLSKNVQKRKHLRDAEFEAELRTVVVMQNGPERVFLQRQTHLPRHSPHLSREPRLSRTLLVFKSVQLNVRSPEARRLVDTVKLVSGVVVEEERKPRSDGSDGVPVPGRQTENLALEILLHGVVVADEDVTADGLVPGESLRGRKSLEPLVQTIIFFLVVVLMMILILPILLGDLMMIFIDDPFALQVEAIAALGRGGWRRVDALVETAVDVVGVELPRVVERAGGEFVGVVEIDVGGGCGF